MPRQRTYADPPPGYLWEAAAAARIGTRPTTLSDWRRDGKPVPACIRIGWRTAYKIEALDEWLASRPDAARSAHAGSGVGAVMSAA
jgi:hypothetical protein